MLHRSRAYCSLAAAYDISTESSLANVNGNTSTTLGALPSDYDICEHRAARLDNVIHLWQSQETLDRDSLPAEPSRLIAL